MLSARARWIGLLLVATPELAADTLPTSWRTRIDAWHDALYFGVQRELRELDASLAGEPPSQPPTAVDIQSPFRLELDLSVFERDSAVDVRAATRFDIDLRLPRLEQRLRLFLTTDDLSETVTDVARDLRAGLRVDAFSGADVEIGIKLDAPPVAFAALRWGEEYRRGSWWIHPFAKVFVDSSQGPGVGTALVIDHWEGSALWRSSSSVLGLPRRSSTIWSQSLIWARTTDILREGRPLARVGSRDIVHGWGLELSVSGEKDRLQEKEWALFYKYPLQSDWLFVSVRPFWRSFRAETEAGRWSRDVGVTLGVDMLFWGPAGKGRSAP